MTTETSPDADPGRPRLSAAERLAVALGTSATAPAPRADEPDEDA